MPRKLKISFFLFLIIVLLPTLIFSLYEISSFTQYEELIEEASERWLETPLFSINQHTEEVITEWTKSLNDNMGLENQSLDEFLNINPSIDYIFTSDGEKLKYSSKWLNSGKKDSIETFIQKKQEVINKLKEYIKNDYRKPEAFQFYSPKEIIVLFICDHVTNKDSVCGIVFDTKKFIEGVLGPKAQEIARENLNIFVFEGLDKNLVYNTDMNESSERIIIEKPFWLLPGYGSGISLKSKYISEIVKPHTRNLLILIIAVNIALLFGVYMLFRNMKGEMELTLLKSEFVSNVSHEIRTPLALIQMYIETLDMDRVKTEEKKKEYYNIVLQETMRLSGIVNKILNFTQMEKGNRKYQFSDTSVNEIVEKIMTTYKFHLENKGFDYSVDLVDELPIIFADKEAINDCVINLIDNAIKYSADRKMIVLRTGKIDERVFIEVKDFGIGISEKDQKHIFEKFYRVTTGDLAHKAKGTGLGLTIVKHVMDAHKGEIIIKSKANSGCSFKLVFPPEGALA